MLNKFQSILHGTLVARLFATKPSRAAAPQERHDSIAEARRTGEAQSKLKLPILGFDVVTQGAKQYDLLPHSAGVTKKC